MSMLFSRVSKLSVPSPNKIRLVSASTVSPSLSLSTPYLLLNLNVVGKSSSGDGKVVNINLYNPSRQENVKIRDKTLSDKLLESNLIGSLRGWVILRDHDDFGLRLTNIFNPSASDSSHKLISLPPLIPPHNLNIYNVALSSSPDHDDCVVAVKFRGPYLSLCRRGDSGWTHIRTPWTCMASDVIYSKRDQKFYVNRYPHFPPMAYYQEKPHFDMPGMSTSQRDQFLSCFRTQMFYLNPDMGPHYRYVTEIDFPLDQGSESESDQFLSRFTTPMLDLNMNTTRDTSPDYEPDLLLSCFEDHMFCLKETATPDTGPTQYDIISYYEPLPFCTLHGMSTTELDQILSCTMRFNLVESPCGEHFMVVRCYQVEEAKVCSTKIERLMVFRQDTEKGIGCYTEDIGDLCIFLSSSEPFCVSASMHPGLKPNSIYISGGSEMVIYDLKSRTFTDVNLSFTDVNPSLRNALYWLAPLDE